MNLNTLILRTRSFYDENKTYFRSKIGCVSFSTLTEWKENYKVCCFFVYDRVYELNELTEEEQQS